MSSENKQEAELSIDPKKISNFIKKTDKALAVLGKMCSFNGWVRDEEQLALFSETITGIKKSLESIDETQLAKAADNLLTGAKQKNYTLLAITVPDFLKRLNERARVIKSSGSPNEKASNSDKVNEQSSSNVFMGKKIMVVDDSATNRMVIFSVLSQKGAQIIQGKDGSEAVKIYKENNGDIDLILMDLDMPEMNGIDAAQNIRDSGLHGCTEVPILVLSANLDNRKFRSMSQACFNDFMSKPVMPQILYNALEKYLKK